MNLDRESRRVLNAIRAGEPDNPPAYTFEHAAELASLDDVDIRVVGKLLVQEGYCEYANYVRKDGSKRAFGLMLTQRGRAFDEYVRLTRRQLWLNRLWGFLSGVGVTVLGGLVTQRILALCI